MTEIPACSQGQVLGSREAHIFNPAGARIENVDSQAVLTELEFHNLVPGIFIVKSRDAFSSAEVKGKE